MLARIGRGWRLAALVAAAVSAGASPSDGQTALEDQLKRWSELRLDGPGRAVLHLTLSSGHLTVALATGSAAAVRAGDQVVGVFFRGAASLEYVSADPTEFPVVAYNVKHSTKLDAVREGERLVIRDAFTELLWLAAGADLPSLPQGPPGEALDRAFADHVRKFAMVYAPPAGHEFAAWRLNDLAHPLVRAEFSGGAEDHLYVFDAAEARSESLYALNKNQLVTDWIDRVVVSEQPVGRERGERALPRFALTQVDLAVTASNRRDVAITATETYSASEGQTRVLRLHLLDRTFSDSIRDERRLRVKGVFDDAGRALTFDHRNGVIVVGLTSPLTPEKPVSLRFDLEGDILFGPGGDSYWELGTLPWFPQPGLSAQSYRVHTVVRVKKPYVPFTPGKTLRRGEDGEYNLVETRIDKPVQMLVVVAGKYAFEEDTRDGLTVRVASYAGRSVNLRRLNNLAREMIGYYESFLGPFPFDEFNIVEIHALGFAQAPAAFMFITSEAFSPLPWRKSRFPLGNINERFAHEIAHQYWGHVVMIGGSEEAWLSESFAEICAGLLLRWAGDKEAFERIVTDWRHEAQDASAIAPIPLASRIHNESNQFEAETKRIDLLYGKGPLLLNSIRLDMGDEAFLGFLHLCLGESTWKYGDTRKVEATLGTITGKSWKPFFDAYYWGTALPAR